MPDFAEDVSELPVWDPRFSSFSFSHGPQAGFPVDGCWCFVVGVVSDTLDFQLAILDVFVNFFVWFLEFVKLWFL